MMIYNVKNYNTSKGEEVLAFMIDTFLNYNLYDDL